MNQTKWYEYLDQVNLRNSIKSYTNQSNYNSINSISMYYLAIKYLITAWVIVLASEAAKTSDKIWALIVALPLMTILTLTWLYIEWAWWEKISNHAYYTFWYVLPTLPMFLVFPFLMSKFWFPIALGISLIVTVIIFLVYAFFMKRFGISLLP